MKELVFVVKAFIITLVVVTLMQVRVGELTLEERASVFIQDSWMTEQVQEVGDGLQKLLAQVTGTLGKKMGSIFKKEKGEVAERGNFQLERSSSYLKDKEARITADESDQ